MIGVAFSSKGWQIALHHYQDKTINILVVALAQA